MSIRRVTPADGVLLRDVRLRALRTDPLSFGSSYEREAAYPDERWDEWVAEDAEGEEAVTFFAMQGPEAVGLVGAYRDGEEPGVYHVIAMWVAPEARGQGLGRALLEEVEGWIASCGGREVQLSVTERAEAAAHLYARAGYDLDGKIHESRHTPGLLERSLRKRLG